MNSINEACEKKTTKETHDDYGYLITYIPFRAKMEGTKNKTSLTAVNFDKDLKLIVKPVEDNIKDNVKYFVVYESDNEEYEKRWRLFLSDDDKKTEDNKESENKNKTEEEKKIDAKKKKYSESIKDIEEIISLHCKDYCKKNKIAIPDKYKNKIEVIIDNISFSVYNDNGGKKIKKGVKNTGFFKVTIKIILPNNKKEESEISEDAKKSYIASVYDVISRNIKNRFDENAIDMKIKRPENLVDDLKTLIKEYIENYKPDCSENYVDDKGSVDDEKLNLFFADKDKLYKTIETIKEPQEKVDKEERNLAERIYNLRSKISIYTLFNELLEDAVINGFGKNSKENYKLKIESQDWLFNYKEQERKCYTFAYYTVHNNIERYDVENNKKNIRDTLYRLSRLHENGAIRTYNKDNEVFTEYHDDTSAIWGISRVGIASIVVTTTNENGEEKERDRNISVLNNDFSLIYEFCLHQKFFQYLLIDNKELSSKQKDYLLLNLDFTRYNDIFCPNVISEFETQEVYEAIRDKLEITKIMDDAKGSIENLRVGKTKQVKERGVLIAAFVFAFTVFPSAIYGFLNDFKDHSTFGYKTFYESIIKSGWKAIVVIGLIVIGLLVYYGLYRVIDRYKND